MDAFCTDLQSVCGFFNVEPVLPKNSAMKAHLSVEKVGGLYLARIGLDANQVHRSKVDIRQDPGEHFFFISVMASINHH